MRKEIDQMTDTIDEKNEMRIKHNLLVEAAFGHPVICSFDALLERVGKMCKMVGGIKEVATSLREHDDAKENN